MPSLQMHAAAGAAAQTLLQVPCSKSHASHVAHLPLPAAHPTSAGLVLAAELNRSLVLPDLILDGYMPDAREYVTPDKADTSPFGWVELGCWGVLYSGLSRRRVAAIAAAPWPLEQHRPYVCCHARQKLR